MKKTVILSACVAAFFAVTGSAQAQMKIGTVDMNKIFSSYYKTKDAETRINNAKTKAKQEFDDKMDQLKKDAADIKKLSDEVNNPALSKESKEDKMKALEEKKNQFGPAERELREFQTTQEKQLQDQAVRMRNGIVEEITKLVNDKVKSEQYDLVFDRSGNSLNGVPILVFARDTLDFSDEIITQLNKNKPKEEATPEPKAEKPEKAEKTEKSKKEK